jgi:hypothetical protein
MRGSAGATRISSNNVSPEKFIHQKQKLWAISATP